MTRDDENRSLSRRIIEDYHRVKRYVTFRVVLMCGIITSAAGAITYQLTCRVSKATTLNVITIPAVISVISLVATFERTPRFVFVFSILIGIVLGAIIRYSL